MRSLRRRQVTASAPGKTILFGEHAVVYGHPAITTTVGLRLFATASDSSGSELHLKLADYSFDERFRWDELERLRRRCRRMLSGEGEIDGPGRLQSELSEQPSLLPRLAVAETLRELGALAEGGRKPEWPGVRLEIRSDLPIGAGFGSSAALAGAVILAVTRLVGHSWPVERIRSVAHHIEEYQHGTPSGVDTATVVSGGSVLAERGEDRSLEFRPFEVRSSALDEMRLYHTGSPRESTGVVVAAVRARRLEAPHIVDKPLSRIGEITRRARVMLGDADGTSEQLKAVIRDCERALEQLGVVPAPVRKVLDDVHDLGGAGKISGAGALTGNAAGLLLVLPPASSQQARWVPPSHWKRYNINLDVDGLRVESEQ